jgi:glycosyltransferase involved in cell wall biosynthesis
MEIGGSQLNAIEIAAAVRDRGHQVMVLSRAGPLVETVQRLGLCHVLLDPRARRTPSRHATVQLMTLVAQLGIDVVHGYEWPPAVEAFAGPRLRLGLPVVCTVMSMAVPPFLPRTMPLIVGTEKIRLGALAAGHGSVTLLEPPVDVRANAPDFGPGTFRAEFGLRADLPLVVVVCRLVPELKLEGLLSACDAVAELAGSGRPAQLVIVGDGPARPVVQAAAAAANARAGSTVAVLSGQLDDPRPAYAAADVMLGMGGSALRGLAFGKPLVVQGEHGFWELLTPESAPMFLRQGWYGVGRQRDGRTEGAARLAGILRGLLDSPGLRARLGTYGRELIVQRFSLDRAAAAQEVVYAAAAEASGRLSGMALTADAIRSGIGIIRHKTGRRWQRWRRGTVAADDFNAISRMQRREEEE